MFSRAKVTLFIFFSIFTSEIIVKNWRLSLNPEFLTKKTTMRIGILTSGGDCPGINATIRGVCKTAINHYGMEVIGIHSGFQGLLTKDIEPFTDKSLSGLLNQGGTMLGTSREKPFKKGGVVSDVDNRH